MSSEEAQEDLRCRFCLAMEVEELIPLFCIASTQKILISHMALACTGIVITCRDKLPQYTCDGCLGNLDIAYSCWKRCRESWGHYKRNPALDADAEDYRCRICHKDDVEELISLFCVCDSQLMKISDIIQRFSGLNVSEKDKFPQYICDVCLGELNTGFNFRKLTQKSNGTLRRSIEIHSENEYPNQTNNSSEASHDNSISNEFLNFSDPLEQTSPKTKTPVKYLTEKKAKEVDTQKSATSDSKPAKAASPNFNILNKSQIIIRKPTPARNVFATKESNKDSPSATLNPGKTKGQTAFRKPQATSKSNTHETPIATSSFHTVTAVRSASDGQRNFKKRSFSNPAEFKMLASRILKKSAHEPSSTPVVPEEACATLSANEYTIINKKSRFAWSQITAFLCNNCDNVCSASAMRSTCIKCKLRFDNWLPIGLEHKPAQQGYVEAYCCGECKFFSISLESLLMHQISHHKVPNASKRAPTKQFDKPEVRPTQSNKPVSIKRRVEEPPNQSAKPVSKKQRSEPVSKVLADKWKSVEPGSKIIPRIRQGAPSVDSIVDTDSENDSTPDLQVEKEYTVSKPTRIVEIDDSDDDNESDPEAQDKQAWKEQYEQLEADMDFEYDPLDNIDTTDVIETELPTDSLPYDTLSDQIEQEDSDEFTGFEEEQSVAPKLEPLAGITPDSDIFDTLKDSDEYLMVFLKGVLCCGCMKPFKSLEQLKKHLTHNHPKTKANVNNSSCRICRTSCTNAEDHRMLSSKKIFYYCKFCQCLLVSEEDFHIHRESNHSMEKQLLSPIRVPKVYNVMLSKLKPKVALRKL